MFVSRILLVALWAVFMISGLLLSIELLCRYELKW